MCRNIRVLFNFEPPATPDEVRAAATQYVRKVGGGKPSKVNEVAYAEAIDAITAATQSLIEQMQTKAPPKDRERFEAQRRARSERRFRGA